MIIDGEMVPRGTVVDEEKIPKHMRTEKYVNKVDLSGRDGLVMLLHGIGYTSEQVVAGTIMGYPVFLTQGELIRLSDIPPRQREGLKEGVDYITEWNEKQRGKLRHEETERRQEFLQPEPIKTYDLGWKGGR
jgi:hypothetical protein